MCQHAHCKHTHALSADWLAWSGDVELREIWIDAERNVHRVTPEQPAPSGAITELGMYGLKKSGGVFWIADFPITAYAAAEQLMLRLKRAHEDAKEVARLTECLESPVGYINQHDLEILRSTGEVSDVTLTTHPSGYHNAAIYAQD